MLKILESLQPKQDLVDVLLDCHAKIRHFGAMAQRLAEVDSLPESEVASASAGVWNYFARALPLHVRDEEEDVLPLLRGRRPDLDQALATMSAEHASHQAPLGQLLELCTALRAAPDWLPTLRPTLLSVTQTLNRLFAEHLALEESVIFPALREAPEEEQRRVLQSLRARRAPR